MTHRRLALLLAPILGALALLQGCAHDPLPSWNDTETRREITSFIERTTSGLDAIPREERIAVIDNDGTLWAEQPMYFQLYFALDRVKALAPQHPEWRTEEPFASLLRDDLPGALSGGTEGLLKVMGAAHSGMTTEEFDAIAREWLRTARHPTTGRPFTEMVYQPMLELLDYLRSRGYRTYIVSGGGVDFLRAFAEEVYGVPPEQVVGTLGKLTYTADNNDPRIVKDPEIAYIDDKDGKPVMIQRRIGRRPVIAVGNSDGDFPMLEWTTAGDGPRLGVYIHHTDAAREWAYDRDSKIGTLKKGLDEAPGRGWILVDIARDWERVFPPE